MGFPFVEVRGWVLKKVNAQLRYVLRFPWPEEDEHISSGNTQGPGYHSLSTSRSREVVRRCVHLVLSREHSRVMARGLVGTPFRQRFREAKWKNFRAMASALACTTLYLLGDRFSSKDTKLCRRLFWCKELLLSILLDLHQSRYTSREQRKNFLPTVSACQAPWSYTRELQELKSSVDSRLSTFTIIVTREIVCPLPTSTWVPSRASYGACRGRGFPSFPQFHLDEVTEMTIDCLGFITHNLRLPINLTPSLHRGVVLGYLRSICTTLHILSDRFQNDARSYRHLYLKNSTDSQNNLWIW